MREMTKTPGTELYSKTTRSRHHPADVNVQSFLVPTDLGPVAAANFLANPILVGFLNGVAIFDEAARDNAFAPGAYSEDAAGPFAHARRGRTDDSGDAGRLAV